MWELHGAEVGAGRIGIEGRRVVPGVLMKREEGAWPGGPTGEGRWAVGQEDFSTKDNSQN